MGAFYGGPSGSARLPPKAVGRADWGYTDASKEAVLQAGLWMYAGSRELKNLGETLDAAELRGLDQGSCYTRP